AAGTDRVHGDPERRQLLRHRLREPDHAELRRGVGPAPRRAALARDRRHVDDPAGAAGEHGRDHGAAHQERALEIDVEHEVPRVFRHFPQQPVTSTIFPSNSPTALPRYAGRHARLDMASTSLMTSTTAGLLAASALSSADLMSSGRSTRMPTQPMASATFAKFTSWLKCHISFARPRC